MKAFSAGRVEFDVAAVLLGRQSAVPARQRLYHVRRDVRRPRDHCISSEQQKQAAQTSIHFDA